MERINANRRAFTLAGLIGGSPMLLQTGSAQSSGTILNKKQLADLEAKAKTADDHRKLAAHYRAVSAKHEAEAKEHRELTAKYRANPTGGESKHPACDAVSGPPGRQSFAWKAERGTEGRHGSDRESGINI